jgi:4-aminobutyrate aminotransferase-like enzyme
MSESVERVSRASQSTDSYGRTDGRTDVDTEKNQHHVDFRTAHARMDETPMPDEFRSRVAAEKDRARDNRPEEWA